MPPPTNLHLEKTMKKKTYKVDMEKIHAIVFMELVKVHERAGLSHRDAFDWVADSHSSLFSSWEKTGAMFHDLFNFALGNPPDAPRIKAKWKYPEGAQKRAQQALQNFYTFTTMRFPPWDVAAEMNARHQENQDG